MAKGSLWSLGGAIARAIAKSTGSKKAVQVVEEIRKEAGIKPVTAQDISGLKKEAIQKGVEAVGAPGAKAETATGTKIFTWPPT